MEIEDIAGVAIFAGTFMILAVVMTACMERRLARIDKVVRLIESDNKYVN
jgi:hypothetical protein